MIYPLVRDLAVDSIHKIPVAVTCRVLGFSKQAYFKWLADPVSRRDWDDAHLINAALDIHHDDPEFGYPSSQSMRSPMRSRCAAQLAPWCTPTAAVSSAPMPSSAPCATQA